MDRTVVIHQPDFIPYIGFFHRLLHADIYIILDHVQMSKSGWVHRDQIKTQKGIEWITVPIKKLGDQPIIREARIDLENKLFKKNVNLIETNYTKAPFFKEIFPEFRNIYLAKHQLIAELNQQLLRLLFDAFDIKIVTVLSSDLGVTTLRSKMNADLVKSVGGTIYLSGTGAKDYHTDEPFEKNGIRVEWQKFIHPVYPQLYDEFIPYLSCVDLLFNCGIKKSREILREIV